MYSNDVKARALLEVSKVIPEVYRRRWDFDEVADFVLLNFICDGSISEFQDYLSLKKDLVDYLKQGLKNYLGGVK